MKKYEVKLSGPNSHSYFVMAKDSNDAVTKIVNYHNDTCQNKKSLDDPKIIVCETHKKKLDEICQKFTPCFDNGVDYELVCLRDYIDHVERYGKFIMEPNFQRCHVWTEEQQIKYLEYVLRGGISGKIFYVNRRDDWDEKNNRSYETVLVDGLQRMTAILKFIDGELKVFGGYSINDIERVPIHVRIVKNNLKTDKEIMQWYIDLNAGGTPHTYEEIEKVKTLMTTL